MEDDPKVRAATLLAKQTALREKMVEEGKHAFNAERRIRSKDEHIGDWIKPTLKAIKRKNRKADKKPVAIITPIKLVVTK